MSSYALSCQACPSRVESDPMAEVNVPGMVSKPPDTNDRQMEETSTPVSFVSSSFRMEAEIQGLSVVVGEIS